MNSFAPFIFQNGLSAQQEMDLFQIQSEVESGDWSERINSVSWLDELVKDTRAKFSGPEFRGAVLSFSKPGQKTILDPLFIAALSQCVGEMFGELLIQNEQGDRVVYVYDRDREFSMHKGSRYHQTREGGSLHTDNVNIPEPWDYLLFTCLAPAEVGGESILVDGRAIQQVLSTQFPQALKTLEAPFIWEMRGVADRMYEAPVIIYTTHGEPLFRYLRPYMTAAHLKSNQPLTIEQLYALDVLDALLESQKYQHRKELLAGDMLVTKDSQVFHGRTCFSDSLDSVDLNHYKLNQQLKLKRTMMRLWIKGK